MLVGLSVLLEMGSVLAEWVGAVFDGFCCSEGAEEMGGWGWWWHCCGVGFGIGVGWGFGVMELSVVGCDVLWEVVSGCWCELLRYPSVCTTLWNSWRCKFPPLHRST